MKWPTIATTTEHYSSPGQEPAWTSNTSGETARNIAGVDGSLAATQANLETPVLQLENLNGSIIATAYLSETATGLASKADVSEYGVPTTSLPPKYSWLGAIELPTELSSGVMNMGARSYVPALGRYLQPDPLPGGSADAYAYTFGDPLNTYDPSGEYTAELNPGTLEANIHRAEEDSAEVRRLAEEAAARAEAERWAKLAAEFGLYAGPQYEGEAVPLGGYAGWACQYARETGQQDLGCEGTSDLGSLFHAGDGRGDGCYIHGVWQCASGHGHKRGEKINENPWEPVEAFCWLFPNPICTIGEKIQKTKH